MKNTKELDELSVFFTVELIKNWFKYQGVIIAVKL